MPTDREVTQALLGQIEYALKHWKVEPGVRSLLAQCYDAIEGLRREAK